MSAAALQNWSFYRMHYILDVNADAVYKIINSFASEQCICFMADTPQLIKTLRNVPYHSGT